MKVWNLYSLTEATYFLSHAYFKMNHNFTLKLHGLKIIYHILGVC